MRSRGMEQKSTLRLAMARSSRFSESQLARKMTTSTLATSPGWNENSPKKLTHSLEPPDSKPTNMGSSRQTTPARPNVYL